jgi:hypothetical protein
MRWRFDGEIAGCGSSGGVRVVVGRWTASPFGPFADVMLEQADGHRVLLAPAGEVAEFVASAYRFDEVVPTPVRVDTTDADWRVTAEGLRLDLGIGRRPALGWLLRAVPGRLASTPRFAGAVDPAARVVLRGVRTTGRTRSGQRQWYGARDLRVVDRLRGTWRGHDLGEVRPVVPPVRFGFASTPPRPGVTRVSTTIEVAGG